MYERPAWVRRLNSFTPATDGASIVPLDPDEILATAVEACEAKDLGDMADAEWMECFRQRIRSIDREADANLLGRLLCRAEAIRVLQTNLLLRKAWADEPAILDEPIERPLFVVGAPRTGTTILLELLALDPNLRAPISWESHHPLPHGELKDDASRLAVAEGEQEFWADIQPELMTVHELRADLPCECVHYMALDFAAGYWGMQYATPGYDEWAGAQTGLVERTYRAHRRFLQTLQHGGPQRQWLLKTPGHLMTMEALFAEYPDALIVHTHRDPIKFVGSAANTTATIRWLRSDVIPRKDHGIASLFGLGLALNQVMELRKAGAVPAKQIVDAHYRDLLDDPPAAIRSIYDAFGLDWPEGHEQRITEYLRDKPKAKFGKHEYRLEDYELSESGIREHYQPYVDYYGIASED